METMSTFFTMIGVAALVLFAVSQVFLLAAIATFTHHIRDMISGHLQFLHEECEVVCDKCNPPPAVGTGRCPHGYQDRSLCYECREQEEDDEE